MAERSLFEADVRAQPEAFRMLATGGPDRWEKVLDAMARSPEGGCTLLVGMGSSYMAATGAAVSWSAWGVPARAELASDLLHYGAGLIGPRDRVILISQSGASVEVVKLADQLRDQGIPLTAVVNRADSPLAGKAQAVFTMELAPDHGVAVKSFGGTLLTLLYLGYRLAGGPARDWSERALAVASALEEAMAAGAVWRALGADLARRPAQPAVVTLARGPLLAGARGAALLCNEVAKVPAWCEEAGEFRHGIVEMCDERVAAAVMIAAGSGADLQLSLAAELQPTGALVLAVAPPAYAGAASAAGARVLEVPDVPEDYASPLYVLPFQWLTLGWAETRGIRPGQFRYIPGVITSETGGRRS